MKNPEAVRRFQREWKAAAKLFHPNIVTAFDAGDQKGIHYLVMEYVEGPPTFPPGRRPRAADG